MMLCHFVQDDCLAAGGDADAYIVQQINTTMRQWPDPYAKSAYTRRVRPVFGPFTNNVRTEWGEGVAQKTIVLTGCVSGTVTTWGGGPKNPKIFADVICERPLGWIGMMDKD